MENLYKHVGEVNTLLERYGVRFGIYKNGVFKWKSDQTALWDSSVVKKNIRTIYSEKPDVFIITDEFEFANLNSVSVNFHQQQGDLLSIEPLSEYDEMRCVRNICGERNTDRMSYITPKGLKVKFVCEISVKAE